MVKIWEYESKGEDRLSKKVEKDKDIVMTNPEMAKYLISMISLEVGDNVMEPCLGKGAFYNALPDYVNKHYCEINEGKDYLLYDGMVDITLSNPPFVPRSLFWNFHKTAMRTTRKAIYWLINLSSLNVFTPKRLNEMKEEGWYIKSIHIVSDKRWFGWIS